MMAIPLAIRKTVGQVTRVIYPSYGACRRCGLSWAVVKYHETPIDDNLGCFALCESCWANLTPEERLPYYQKYLNGWVSRAIADGDMVEAERLLGVEWQTIRAAVLRGE